MNRSARTALVALCLLIAGPAAAQAEPVMVDYTSTPPFMTITPTPNVMILFDNSGSMFWFAYNYDGANISVGFDPDTEYSGYFNPDAWYTYQSAQNRFVVAGTKAGGPKGETEWDGNFLNWLTMRRIDIARQVLVGGKCAARYAATPVYDLLGEKGDFESRGYRKRVTNAEAYAPSTFNGTRCFTFDLGSSGTSRFSVGTSTTGSCPSFSAAGSFTVRVRQTEEPIGVIQQVGDKVRWGVATYNLPEWSPLAVHGGRVAVNVGDDNVSEMVTFVENEARNTATPLAESLWTCTGYFARNGTTGSTGPRYYSDNARSYSLAAGADPYYFEELGRHVECAKSFVIVLTDGEPTHDLDVPGFITGYAPPYTDGSAPVPPWADPPNNYFWNDTGSHYLDDVALWARVDLANQKYRDLRTDLPGDQYLTTYYVWASFGDATPDGRRLLMQAARAGSFLDRNDNFIPDLCCEYRREGACEPVDNIEDCPPDAYFEADSGAELASALNQVMSDILRRTSAGTAVSILSTSAHGEGALFQAYFKPKEIRFMGGESVEADWMGFLHGLWVDDHGNLREDNGDRRLVYEEDHIIRFYMDDQGETRIKRDLVSAENPYGTGTWQEMSIPLEDMRSLWEAGRKLAVRDLGARPRRIYTTLDGTSLLPFEPGEAATLKDYLRAASEAEAGDIIRYIRGEDIPGMRPRRMFVDTTGNGTPDTEGTWRLGDIVHSTPAVVGRPMENYDDIYSDESYGNFERKYRGGLAGAPLQRPTVVYVGANDGMLHAFNAGTYRSGDDPSTPVREHGRYTEEYPAYYTSALGYSPRLGEEIWAYIPKNLLPHLRWLTDPFYTHVYYVDLKPKIVDARIFPASDKHPGGWGTVLIGGLGLGGGAYPAGGLGTFSSSYFALDITNPGDPRLLWEFSDPGNLGFTTSYPAVGRKGDPGDPGSWYVIFGSGPTDYDGSSDQNASIYVLDLKTGAQLRRIETDGNAFAGGAATVDLNLDYNTNAAYIGVSHRVGGVWQGKMYRVLMGTGEGGYDPPAAWSASLLATTRSGQAVVVPPAVGGDHQNMPWVYWGTGKFFDPEDKMDTTTQSFYGVKDSTLAEGADALAHAPAALMDVTAVTVTYGSPSTVAGSTVVGGGSSWEDMLEAMRGTEGSPTHGWVLDLVDTAGANRGERVLEKASVFGGLTMFSSFMPTEDVCGFGGEGRLYTLYYETGTAYKRSVFGEPVQEGDTVERSLDLDKGRPSSLAVHIGQQEGGTVYVQQSTGEIQEIETDLPFHQKSGDVLWYER